LLANKKKSIYTASIVLHKTSFSAIQNLLDSILNSGIIDLLFLIDNSAIDDSFLKISDDRIRYDKSSKNIGFGSAHNVALKKAYEFGSNLHFFINPDITLSPEVIHSLIESMNTNPSIGLMMPTILNSDGSIQYLPKLLPSPLSIVARKIDFIFPFFRNYVYKYELRNLPSVGLFDIPVISGCFSVIRMDAIEQIGYFDERYFLYFEDWDLSRRVSTKYRTVINTSIHVIHDYNSGANKHIKLFYIYILSAFKYFKKWGFIFDTYRRRINKKTLSSFHHA
jgi:GT2 family glycosyltransferase